MYLCQVLGLRNEAAVHENVQPPDPFHASLNSPVYFTSTISFTQVLLAQSFDKCIDAILGLQDFSVHAAHLEEHARLATLQLCRESLVQGREMC